MNNKGDNEQRILIQKLHEHVEALQNGNISWLEENFSDRYFFINPTGSVASKSETVALLKSGAIELKSVNIHDEILNVFGEAAVVSVVNTVNCLINNIDISGKYRYTYFFVKQGGRWQIVAEQCHQFN